MRLKTVHLAVKMTLLRKMPPAAVGNYHEISRRLIAFARQTGKPSRDRLLQQRINQLIQEGIDREVMMALTGRAETPYHE